LDFFPLSGSSKYIVGSPLFNSLKFKHENGTLTIIAHNNSKENVYVEKSLINGRPFSLFLDHFDLIKGDVKIEFFMKNKPNNNR